MSPSAGGDREALFLAQLDLIERVVAFVCARHHLAPADADDFASFVTMKFVENDYALLAKFEGRSSLRTFLTVVIQRLFLDHRISAWGKWRPSAAAKRGGPVALLLERLMVRDHYGFDEACEVMRTNHGVTEGRAELEALAAKLPSRAPRRFEPDKALVNVPSPDRPAEDVVAERDHQAMAERIGQVLPSLMARLEPQDRLILTLRFEDGRTVAEIASMLRLDQKGLYRRVQRLLLELRRSLEAAGIASTAVLDMLESPAVSVEWRRFEDAEKPMERPSMTNGAPEWR